MSANATKPPRAIGPFLTWLVGAVVLGALAAPPVFNALMGLGRTHPAWEDLRAIEFERVASRCVMLFALAGLPWLLGRLRVRSWADAGWPRRAGGARTIARAFAIGALTLLAVWGAGWIMGIYAPGEARPARLADALIGALLVGVLEETLFRGLLFGQLRRRMGFASSAALSSLLFAAMHFAKPAPPVGVVHGHWYSGLTLVPFMFGHLNPRHFVIFPYALTLFVMGLALCALTERKGDVRGAVGLHAGWVFGLRAGALFLTRAHGEPNAWFGPGAQPAYGYLATAVTALFAVVWTIRRRPPHAAPADVV